MYHRFSVRIVRLANFVSPISGGLRTTLNALGEGYVSGGHDAVLVVPGERDGEELTPSGRVVSVKGIPVPFLGGYRVLPGRRRLARLLAS
jgi:alpha-1,6-mannosyltransferase